MDPLDEQRQDTSIILDNCADILLSPLHTRWDYDSPNALSLVEKNRTSAAHSQNVIKPYSMEQLLARLSTFNPCGWNIPSGIEHKLSELTCASNGWMLHTQTPSQNTYMNHIICEACGSQLILRFEASGIDSDLDHILAESYAKQIVESGHAENCLWREFEVPLEGSYYMRMLIPETEEAMSAAYLSNLKSFADSRDICQVVEKRLKLDLKTLQFAKEFVDATQEWLTRRFYRHDKENVRIRTQMLWTLELAAWGWSLHHHTMNKKIAIKLHCDLCFQTIFLALEEDLISLSQEIATDAQIDPRLEHKPWCRYSRNMVCAFGDSQKPAAYLIKNFASMMERDD